MSELVDITFSEMVTLLKNLIQNKDSGYAQNTIEPVLKHVVIPQVARRHHWRGVTRPYKKTLTSGIDEYILPYDFDKFIFLKSKYGRMHEMTEKDFYEILPDRTGRSSNIITRYFIEKHEGVHTQPTSAEPITFASGTEDGSKTLLIRGEVNATDFYEELTLNASGTATTTKSFTNILYVSRGSTFTNKLTFTGATSSTEFGYISPEHRTSRFNRLILDSAPSEALELVGQYLSKSFSPKRNDDVFRVPADLVFQKALNILQFERRQPDLALIADKQLDKELALAIRNEEKSHAIESQMVLRGADSSLIPDDHPLFD